MDAAVATAFALAVTYPSAGNLAGGGFAVGRTPAGELWALDFRETAPAGTWRDIVPRAGREGAAARVDDGRTLGRDARHRPRPRGPAPPLRKAPVGESPRARGPARARGLPRPARARRSCSAPTRRTSPAIPRRRAIFLAGGRALPAGSLLVQEDLARTLETVAAKGADGFHRGEIARKVAGFVQSTGGVLTEADLAGYRPEWRPPFVFDDGRYRLVTMPLPSSGGFLLASILGQLRFVHGSIEDRDAADTIHLVVESERRAYADRNRFLGDPSCVDVPLASLLAPARLAALGFSIDPARATPSSAIRGGAWPKEPVQTTHFTTATADGGVVSVTYTLNDTFGNHTVVPGVGVLLNNEMDDFAVEPGAANSYGLVQGESNAVRAGARPLSSMTPTIVLEAGRPRSRSGRRAAPSSRRRSCRCT